MHSQNKKLHPIEQACIKMVQNLDYKVILVTISGGADSVALAAAMSITDAKVVAAHCNFHLRGEESIRDQRHTEMICRKLSIPLRTIDFDVARYRESNPGISTEMACRELRHRWFKTLAREINADRIATGHNADDNIETLFLNLLRGSGTSGLKGMLPDTGLIIRPLLPFHRNDIIKFLNQRELSYVTDSTNIESDYRRNFLRNEIIPLLKSRWAGFDKALDKSIKFIREENKVVTDAIDKAMPPETTPLPTANIMAFPDPELLVRRYIEPLVPFSTTAAEVISAIIADKPDKRIWHLRKGTLILQNHLLRIVLT